jgi:hypothetical protein
VNRIVLCILAAAAAAVASWNCAEEVAAAEPAPGVSVEAFVEREYGYFIGDLVRVSCVLSLPRDQVLSEVSLPNVGEERGEWVELSEKKITVHETRAARIYQVDLTYQIVSVSDGTHSFAIPGVDFSYGPAEAPAENASSWPPVLVTVSPLTMPGDGFKPALLWSWNTFTPQVVRGAGAILLLGGMTAAGLVFRGRAARDSMFAKGLERLSGERNPRAALIIFRSVLNEKAGRAIFPTNMEDLLRVFPQAAPHREELLRLVLLSDQVSFNPEGAVPGDGLLRDIRNTMKKMRRLERWR